MSIDIDVKTLKLVLSKMLNAEIRKIDYESKRLHGGTLGDVILITGNAESDTGQFIPYSVVFKSQKKWMRPGDDDSWRREYDLYSSDFNKVLTKSFYWPECYHTEMSNDRIHIWMEYINGVSGEELSIEMLEKAALEIGRFQGRLYNMPELFEKTPCLGDAGVFKREYMQWHKQTYSYEFLISDNCRLPSFLKKMYIDGHIEYNEKTMEYNYLRSSECAIPGHLKQMLTDIDDRMETIFHDIEQLPVVVCHRDYWIENIFYSDGNICAIDWDSAGWGYMGEDIISLVADETSPEYLAEYYHRLIPAYLKGLSENMDISAISNLHLLEMIIIKFGYRILQEYMFTQSPEVKEEQIQFLQGLYDIGKQKK